LPDCLLHRNRERRKLGRWVQVIQHRANETANWEGATTGGRAARRRAPDDELTENRKPAQGRE